MQIHNGILLDAGRLLCHPDTPSSAISDVSYELSLAHSGEWRMSLMIGCPPSALSLPASTQPARRDGLWKTTCFEAFFFDEASRRYIEFNFSPSGEWAVYHFDSYREGSRDFDCPAPFITTTDAQQRADALKAMAASYGLPVDAAALPDPGDQQMPQQYAISASLDASPLPGEGPWRLGLTAVIEEADGTKSYWAINHPPGPPDFHHPDCFVLQLDAAD